MLSFILFVIACATCTHAQDEGIMVPENKTQCINQLAQWCDKMQYPQQGAGLAILSLTYEDPNGFQRVFCSSDSDGTNCTRNRMSWFTCSPDHVLTYKGQVLTNTSTDVDDDVCRTADKAFNELFIQNLSYDNTTMKKEFPKSMEAFFEQMAVMEEQITMIQRMLRKIPALGDFWRGFNDDFLFGGPDSATDVPNDKQNSTEQSNQIERE